MEQTDDVFCKLCERWNSKWIFIRLSEQIIKYKFAVYKIFKHFIKLKIFKDQKI